MKGHIRERASGHWAIIFDVRDPATGRRRRKWHSFAGTKRQAETECARLISAISGGVYLEPAKITVAAHMERWLEHVRSQVSPKTFERYCGVVRGNILPTLGAVLLTKLQPAQISEMYAKALGNGRRDGKGGLSPASVLYMHRLLKEALKVAVSEWRLLPWNPVDSIKAPKIKRKNMRRLTPRKRPPCWRPHAPIGYSFLSCSRSPVASGAVRFAPCVGGTSNCRVQRSLP